MSEKLAESYELVYSHSLRRPRLGTEVDPFPSRRLVVRVLDLRGRMLIPKKNRKAIYEHLFKEGVLWAKKDFNAPQHPEVESVPNLQVIKAMQVCQWRRANGQSVLIRTHHRCVVRILVVHKGVKGASW